MKPNQTTWTETFSKTKFLNKIALLLSSWFGSGLVPRIPGTFGTLAALPLLFIMDILGCLYGGLFLLAFILLAVWTSEISRKLLGRDDPREVVIDEAAGLLMTLFFLPLSGFNVMLGFFLFRFFDILKPFPIRTIDQKLRGGWGIVLDDLLAGVYAHGMIRVVHVLMGYLY